MKKYTIAAVILITLVGCNSSSEDETIVTDDPVSRPQPDYVEPPRPIPDDIVPPRLTPDWYLEASSLYGISVEALESACEYSYQDESGQAKFPVRCYWENDELTLSYNTIDVVGENGHSDTIRSQFNWEISPKTVAMHHIWPSVWNHDSVLDQYETNSTSELTYYAVKRCSTQSCLGEPESIHELVPLFERGLVTANGAANNVGNSYFDMKTYQHSSPLRFFVDYRHKASGEPLKWNTVYISPEFMGLMHPVLAPVFGH